jgi:hypothetical protein
MKASCYFDQSVSAALVVDQSVSLGVFDQNACPSGGQDPECIPPLGLGGPLGGDAASSCGQITDCSMCLR